MPQISERQAMLDDLERWMELKATVDLTLSSESDLDWNFNSSGSINSWDANSWDENFNAELVSDGFNSIDSSSSDEELMELFCMLEESRYVTRPDHLVFHNNSPYAQAAPAMQLTVTLDCFGHEGNGACLSCSLMLWGLEEGSMVNYTNRIMIALRDKLRDLVSWPTASKRRRISAAFVEKGFPRCMGLIDGTLIPLS
ncbi:hypothetical protein R1flu_022050 [Riccia fluitans]|uniref:Uncharacterized protein n=1 Tax=Riccia fluitans TaxID=41844 RepID=A0ABD1ZRR4_9MARC